MRIDSGPSMELVEVRKIRPRLSNPEGLDAEQRDDEEAGPPSR